MSRWVRRREIWLPTAWGWLGLAVALVVALAATGWAAPRYLAVQAPARGGDGQGARTLVVEGWLSRSELAQAAQLIRTGRYTRVLTSGGPIDPEIDVGAWHDFAARAAAHLKRELPDGFTVTPVPAPYTARDRTYLSALRVRDWLRHAPGVVGVAGGPPDALDVYSAGVHGRRSRALYRMAFGPSVEVGVLSAVSGDADPFHWWTTSAGAKTLVSELVSLAWTDCCFWPDASE